VSKLGFTVSLKGGFISLISKSKRIKETSGLDNSVYRASREEGEVSTNLQAKPKD
jgi:hypothetical protein